MSVCNTLTKNIASRKCITPGGVKNKAWVGQVEDFTGAKTYNATTGAISSFSLADGAAFITATSRPRKANGKEKLSQPQDGGVNVEQSVDLEFSYNSKPEGKAIMDFLRAEGKTVFLETNSGTIRQYFHEFGHESMEGEGGTGTQLSEAGGIIKVTLKGNEQDLPEFFEAVISGQLTQLASSKAYLDALVTGNEVPAG